MMWVKLVQVDVHNREEASRQRGTTAPPAHLQRVAGGRGKQGGLGGAPGGVRHLVLGARQLEGPQAARLALCPQPHAAVGGG